MIELIMSNGKYLTHEDLEKYLKDNYQYYLEKIEEDTPNFEIENLIKQISWEFEKSILKFDKIELIIDNITFFEKFHSTDIYFKLTTEILRGEEFKLNSDDFNNDKIKWSTNSMSNIFMYSFKNFDIKSENLHKLRFPIPKILFIKFDTNKPNNLIKGNRIIFNLNLLNRKIDKRNNTLKLLEFIETVGVQSESIFKINKYHNNKSTSETNSKVEGKCYIVTATMGDINHPVVNDFRTYRDNVLHEKYLGRLFIKIYYKIGPSLAKIIESNKILLNTSRKLVFYLHSKIK